jgi:uncharacterized protein
MLFVTILRGFMSEVKINPLNIFISFLVGFLFAAGLIYSKMTDPQVIIGFLDITGDWRPELLFVMAGAWLAHMPFVKFILKKSHPVLDTHFHVPSNTKIDKELILGAALFGAGWGLAGFCPGPAIVSLGTGSYEVLWFVAFMFAGMRLRSRLAKI